MLSDREQALRAMINDSDEEVRKAVAEALEKVEAGLQLDRILEILDGDNRAYKARAILSLGQIHSEKVGRISDLCTFLQYLAVTNRLCPHKEAPYQDYAHI